jgi:hypothetical protein
VSAAESGIVAVAKIEVSGPLPPELPPMPM